MVDTNLSFVVDLFAKYYILALKRRQNYFVAILKGEKIVCKSPAGKLLRRHGIKYELDHKGFFKNKNHASLEIGFEFVFDSSIFSRVQLTRTTA